MYYSKTDLLAHFVPKLPRYRQSFRSVRSSGLVIALLSGQSRSASQRTPLLRDGRERLAQLQQECEVTASLANVGAPFPKSGQRNANAQPCRKALFGRAPRQRGAKIVMFTFQLIDPVWSIVAQNVRRCGLRKVTKEVAMEGAYGRAFRALDKPVSRILSHGFQQAKAAGVGIDGHERSVDQCRKECGDFGSG